jgi:hypothetical protein
MASKTILFAAELAGEEDQLRPMAEVAASLKGAADCVFALPDLSGARQLRDDAAIVPSPRWPAPQPGWRTAEIGDYGDILALVGFGDPDDLARMARAWRSLVGLIGPDMVVAQHAPGLMAALVGAEVPVLTVGSPYTMPPADGHRLASLVAGRRPLVPEPRLIAALARVVSGAAADAPPTSIASLIAGAERFVHGAPELDCYAAERREELLCPPGARARFAEPPQAPRLFVHARADFPGLAVLVQVVAELGIEVSVHVEGEADRVRAFLRARSIQAFGARPDLGQIIAGASHVISHGGAITAAAALAAGRPQLSIPLIHEEIVTARLLERAGAGRTVSAIKDRDEFAATLGGFLADKGLAEAARHLGLAANRRDQRDLVEVARSAILARLG